VDSTFFTTLPRRELRGFYIKRIQDEMAKQEGVDEEELEKVRKMQGKGRGVYDHTEYICDQNEGS
jgi:hypothetical protein